MKAVIIRGYGGPDVIELADVPVPQPGTGQVRIRVRAAPVHPVDIATRAGRLAEHGLMAASGDVGLGWDLAGVVDALGPGVDRFTAGEMVIGMRDLLTAPVGAQAEQVVLDTDAVAPAPRSVTPAKASTIPLNSLTADQALDLLALQPGQWLLVTGAAGALDAGLVGMPALDAVRDKGAFVAVAAGAAPVPLRGTRVHNVWIHTDGPRLAELAALVDAGQLTPRVAATLPLEQVATAHQRVAAGGLRGRIVLTLDG